MTRRDLLKLPAMLALASVPAPLPLWDAEKSASSLALSKARQIYRENRDLISRLKAACAGKPYEFVKLYGPVLYHKNPLAS